MIFTFVDKEVDHSDKGFEKVIANFIAIETVCSKFNTFFFSN